MHFFSSLGRKAKKEPPEEVSAPSIAPQVSSSSPSQRVPSLTSSTQEDPSGHAARWLTLTKKELHHFLKENSSRVIVVIDNNLYDVTSFMYEHPGGEQILRRYNGEECGAAFHRIHGNRGLLKAKPYMIGTIKIPDKK